jgi:2-amino-4-hydroxy-6-hydroxymethyldihydropteridine diphosphokinase
MIDYVLGLGGNKGDVRDTILKSYDLIETQIGKIVCKSSFYKSQSWGFDSEDFINAAIVVKSRLCPEEVLEISQSIEKQMGRKNKSVNGGYTSRILDIDILLAKDLVLQTKTLEIPHPKLHLRNFVLKPLQEIIPQYIHPVFCKTIEELAEICEDKLSVIKL